MSGVTQNAKGKFVLHLLDRKITLKATTLADAELEAAAMESKLVTAVDDFFNSGDPAIKDLRSFMARPIPSFLNPTKSK